MATSGESSLTLNCLHENKSGSGKRGVSFLQLADSYFGAQMKMEELFVNWLCQGATQDVIRSYILDARNGIPICTHGKHVPPRSPPSRKAKKPPALPGVSVSPQNIAQKNNHSNDSPPVTASVVLSNSSNLSSIPRFYTPASRISSNRAILVDSLARRQKDIDVSFEKFPRGIAVDDFVSITKDLCGFPSFFNAPLFHRILATYTNEAAEVISSHDNQTLSKACFIRFWRDEIEPYDHIGRFFRLVKQREADFMVQSDFSPYLQELLTYHPGLDFLAGTPEFQEKYALTVIVRIFYSVDRRNCGRISLRELRRSDLVEAFNLVDEEEDINKVNCYFSYEHFYVLYCKFWELDIDHDFSLNREDLMRYGGHALTRAIVDRIFEHGKRPFGRIQSLSPDEKSRSLNYEDFIYFMLSEEDKGNTTSLRYWFDLIDVNEDDVIRCDEMRFFYHQQMHRMECLGHEVVPFEDIVCQLSDLLNPATEGEFVMSDFTRQDKIRISGVFFNVLFNLSKFIAFEQRDPFMMRQQMAEPELTDWHRFARAEYARMAMEEEGQSDGAMEIDSMDGWYVSEDEADEDHDDFSHGARTTAEAPF